MMSSVFKTVTLGWGGQQYSVTPTMKLINDIEQEVSLARLANRLNTGDIPMSHLSFVVTAMLHSVGVNVSDEEVYREMMTGNEKDVQTIASSVLTAVFPEPKKSEK